MTPAEQLDFVRKQTNCENKSAFARWIGASSQRVDNWATRKSIPKKGADMIHQATGAAVEWLMFQRGEPFPNGPTLYTSGEGSADLKAVAATAEQLGSVVMHLLRCVVAKTPGAGEWIEKALEAEDEGPNSQVIGAALAAVREARRSVPAPRRS